tara:strand:- start:16483 stop:16713 length:231 start_codon:yes stop_codon:yes gene_type:complete
LKEQLRECPDVVYCSKCKYYFSWSGDIGRFSEHCEHDTKKEHDHATCWNIYDSPHKKNKDNNCKHFKLKWWRKLIG